MLAACDFARDFALLYIIRTTNKAFRAQPHRRDATYILKSAVVVVVVQSMCAMIAQSIFKVKEI